MDQQSSSQKTADLAGPGVMLLSAAIFAYFGFSTTWLHHSVSTGQFLLFVAILDYTLKATAIAFGVAAAVSITVSPVAGNLIYGVSGLISAILFVVVAILDWLDPQHTAMSPVLLLIFAAWNGYSSTIGLMSVLSSRQGVHQAPGHP
jgi:hypothetical protein